MHSVLRMRAFCLAFRPLTRADQLAHWRDECVKSLIRHAGAQVPFVRLQLELAGVPAAAVQSVRDLGALPLVSKRQMQDAGISRVLARNVRSNRLLDRSTSGSTGERMIVKRTWFEERLLNAFRWRVLREYGLKRRERVAVALFHRAKDPRDNQILFRLAQRVGLRQMLILDALGDPDSPRAVSAYDPHFLMGMTSAIARLVEDVKAAGFPFRPRVVVTSGELLTNSLRERVSVLDSCVRDVYGSNECNFIAWECPAGLGTYHVCDDAHVVEVLRPDGSPADIGEWGEIVVTSLFSFAMPLIRYRIGDLAVRGPAQCACGSPYSTLLAVQGRTIDMFRLADGRSLHPWEILNVIKPYTTGWVRQFQMVQTAPGAIEFRAVASRPPADHEVAQLLAAAREVLGTGATFKLTQVDSVEAFVSGKSRPFVPYDSQP